jgi:hypothetical protein
MKVQIVDGKDQVVWERKEEGGIACRTYVKDGTQQTIIKALTEALAQAQGELSSFEDSYWVLDIGASATQI